MAEPIRWQDAWWHQQPDGTWLRFNEETQSWEPQGQAQARPVYAPSSGMSAGAKVAIGAGIAFVALLIIAILAAIAIPVFLRQRESGWVSQVESALKNAAVAQESQYAFNGEYVESAEDLDPGLFERSPSVDLVVVDATVDGYCIEGRHDEMPERVWFIESERRLIEEGSCP